MSTSYIELLDRPVVAIDTAAEVGTVKNLVIDRAATRVERIQVAGRSRSPELVEWSQVHSVGSDAVMIGSPEVVHESRSTDDDDLYIRGDIEIIGAQVTTTSGFHAGTVTDLHIDADTGSILAAMTSEGRVAVDRIKSFGTFGLVVQ